MEFKKYRSIKVKFLPATNYRGYRFKLTDDFFNQSLTINCSDNIDSTIEEGINELNRLGFNVIGYSENKDDYSVICDNWGTNCVKLKESNK